MNPEYVNDVNPEVVWCERYATWLNHFWVIAVGFALSEATSIWSMIFVNSEIGVVLVATLGIAGLAFGFIRQRTIRRIRTDARLHSLFHNLRDHASAIASCSAEMDYKYQLDAFHNSVAQDIAAYYGSRLNSSGIGCAIRLAREGKDGKQEYVTHGRSDGFDPNRPNNSQPIAFDEGLPKALSDKDTRGVYIIYDIQAAVRMRIWKFTDNDNLSDVKSLMACPVNGLVNGVKTMIGILYVTSNSASTGTFVSHDTLAMKAIADTLGIIYSVILGQIKLAIEPKSKP